MGRPCPAEAVSVVRHAVHRNRGRALDSAYSHQRGSQTSARPHQPPAQPPAGASRPRTRATWSPPSSSPTTAPAGCPRRWPACSARTARCSTSSRWTPAAPTTPPQLLTETLGDWLRSCTWAAGPASAPPSPRPSRRPPLRPEDLPYSDPSGYDPVTGGWDTDDRPPRTTRARRPARDPPVEWLWLLHDDCEPRPTRCADLLQVADTTPVRRRHRPQAAQLVRPPAAARSRRHHRPLAAAAGPAWTAASRTRASTTRSARCSRSPRAGMLVRRDVLEQLGGFDRAPAADARRHRLLLAGQRRRPPRGGRPGRRAAARRGRQPRTPRHRLRRRPTRTGSTRPAPSTPCSPTPAAPCFPYVLLRLVLGTLLRVLANLVGKDPRPGPRRGRRPGQPSAAAGRCSAPASAARPPGSADPLDDARPVPTARRHRCGPPSEQVVSNLARPRRAGRHHGRPARLRHRVRPRRRRRRDFLEVEQFALLKRLARKPGPVLFAALLRLRADRLPQPARQRLAAGRRPAARLRRRRRPVGRVHRRLAPGRRRQHRGRAALPGHAGAPGQHPVRPTSLALTAASGLSVPLAASAPTSPPGRWSTPGCCAPGARSPTPSCPPPPARWPAAGSAPPCSPSLLPLMARAAVAAGGLAPQAPPGPRPAGGPPGLRPAAHRLHRLHPADLADRRAAGRRRAGRADRPRRRPALLGAARRCASLAVLGTPLLVLAPWSLRSLGHPASPARGRPALQRRNATVRSTCCCSAPAARRRPPDLLLAGVVLAALAALMRGHRRRAILTAWAVALAGLGRPPPSRTTRPGPDPPPSSTASAAGRRRDRRRRAPTNASPPRVRLAPAGGRPDRLRRRAGPADRRRPLDRRAAPPDRCKRRDPAQVPPSSPRRRHHATRRAPWCWTAPGARSQYVPGPWRRRADRRRRDRRGARRDRPAGQHRGQPGGRLRRRPGHRTRPATRVALRAARTAPRRTSAATLDTTPGLTGSARPTAPSCGRSTTSVRPHVITRRPADRRRRAAGARGGRKVEAHTTIPAGPGGRVLRLADTAAPDWQATLNGTALPPTTVDGWAQGFQLPRQRRPAGRHLRAADHPHRAGRACRCSWPSSSSCWHCRAGADQRTTTCPTRCGGRRRLRPAQAAGRRPPGPPAARRRRGRGPGGHRRPGGRAPADPSANRPPSRTRWPAVPEPEPVVPQPAAVPQQGSTSGTTTPTATPRSTPVPGPGPLLRVPAADRRVPHRRVRAAPERRNTRPTRASTATRSRAPSTRPASTRPRSTRRPSTHGDYPSEYQAARADGYPQQGTEYTDPYGDRSSHRTHRATTPVTTRPTVRGATSSDRSTLSLIGVGRRRRRPRRSPPSPPRRGRPEHDRARHRERGRRRPAQADPAHHAGLPGAQRHRLRPSTFTAYTPPGTPRTGGTAAADPRHPDRRRRRQPEQQPSAHPKPASPLNTLGTPHLVGQHQQHLPAHRLRRRAVRPRLDRAADHRRRRRPGQGLLGTACGQAGTDFWFPGASTASHRFDYVSLTNPDNASAVVDIELYGKKGPVKAPNADGITVPPAVQRPGPAVHPGRDHRRRPHRARPGRTGRVAAAIQSTYNDGSDWLPAAATPATAPCCPGIPADAATVHLRRVCHRLQRRRPEGEVAHPVRRDHPGRPREPDPAQRA